MELYLNGICFPNCGPNSYFDPDFWAHFERKELSSQTQLSEVSILVWWIVAWILITQVGAVLQTAMAWWERIPSKSVLGTTKPWHLIKWCRFQRDSWIKKIHRCTKHVNIERLATTPTFNSRKKRQCVLYWMYWSGNDCEGFGMVSSPWLSISCTDHIRSYPMRWASPVLYVGLVSPHDNYYAL